MRSGTELDEDSRTATIVGVLSVVASTSSTTSHRTLGFLPADKGGHDRGRLADG